MTTDVIPIKLNVLRQTDYAFNTFLLNMASKFSNINDVFNQK